MDNVCISEFPGGLRVITVALPHVESVTIGVAAGSGSRYESRRESGVSHFAEHLLFKGTMRRSARDISQSIEGRGGYLNAFTQEENTCYFARIPYNHLRLALDVLCDMYVNPRLAEKDVVRERGVIVEEIMMYRDQPQHVVDEMLGESLWAGHPLGRPVIGSPETLAGMSGHSVRDFLKRHYVTGNTVVAMAGRLEHEACAGMAAEMLAEVVHAKRSRPRPVTAATRRIGRVCLSKDIEQTHLELGFRTFGRHDRRRHALNVMNTIMGENMSSRLFQRIRERSGLAYSVHSHPQMFDETGAWIISAGLDRRRYLKALELIIDELLRLRNKPPGAAELSRAKDYMIGQLRLGMESTSSQMMWLANNLLNHDRFIPPAEMIAATAAVTAAEVTALANEICRSHNLTLAVLGPGIGSADERRMDEITAKLN